VPAKRPANDHRSPGFHGRRYPSAGTGWPLSPPACRRGPAWPVPSQAAPNRIRWARCVRRGVPARPARIGVGM